ncbi:hypothetical protein EVAR_2482_1 [Eumeta japonica]|uniref:Uncharacterized protein n=1 Tax=Eumeta variegata TaxID=151549 RepID=A0A4C1SRA6_EUMVA|nr:hypothetical protein EVAR_2482_1 [Eumeta japonica]
MPYYTPRKYAQMRNMRICGECRGNASRAAALHRQGYPNPRNQCLDYRIFLPVNKTYLEGRIPRVHHGERRPQYDYESYVSNGIDSVPTISVREIQRSTGIPKATVHLILKRNRYHPYHYCRHANHRTGREFWRGRAPPAAKSKPRSLRRYRETFNFLRERIRQGAARESPGVLISCRAERIRRPPARPATSGTKLRTSRGIGKQSQLHI